MSSTTQLHSAVESYRRCLSDENFQQVYLLTKDQRTQNRRILLRSGYGCEHTALEVFDDTLLRLLHKEDVLDFAKMFSVSLRNARLDFYRKESRRLSKIDVPPSTFGDEEDEVDTPTTSTRFVEECSAEEEVFERYKKKKAADIVDHILQSARTKFSSQMIALIEELPRHKTVNALAKAHGLGRNTVDRKIKALSRFYDANRFGDIRDICVI